MATIKEKRERDHQRIATTIRNLIRTKGWDKAKQVKKLNELLSTGEFLSSLRDTECGGKNYCSLYYNQIADTLTRGNQNNQGITLLKEHNDDPLNFLMKKMTAEHTLPPLEKFTPGIAKIILIEFLRQHSEAFESLIRSIELGVNLKDFLKNPYENGVPILAVDGFFHDYLSTPIEPTETSVLKSDGSSGKKSTMSLERNPGADHQSYSCLDLIKSCSSYENDITQEDLNSAGLNNHFEKEKLSFETDIAQGDLIVSEDRVLIFTGYQLTNSTVDFEAIECDQESYTIGSFKRKLYSENEPNICTPFHLGDDPPNTPYYRLRME